MMPGSLSRAFGVAMVLLAETPPSVRGIIDDHWFNSVAGFGNAAVFTGALCRVS